MRSKIPFIFDKLDFPCQSKYRYDKRVLILLCISMYSYIYGWAVLIIDIYDYHKRKVQSNAVIELSKKAWKMKEKENKKKETMFLYLFVCSSCIFHFLYCNTIFTQHFCYLQGVGYRGGFIRKCDYHSPHPQPPSKTRLKKNARARYLNCPLLVCPIWLVIKHRNTPIWRTTKENKVLYYLWELRVLDFV